MTLAAEPSLTPRREVADQPVATGNEGPVDAVVLDPGFGIAGGDDRGDVAPGILARGPDRDRQQAEIDRAALVHDFLAWRVRGPHRRHRVAKGALPFRVDFFRRDAERGGVGLGRGTERAGHRGDAAAGDGLEEQPEALFFAQALERPLDEAADLPFRIDRLTNAAQQSALLQNGEIVPEIVEGHRRPA